MKVMLDNGAIMPTRAHAADAGLDLYTPAPICVEAGQQVMVDTGVHMEIPFGWVGLVRSKSGLMAHDGITTDGTVDSGYTGSIKIVLQNHSRYAKYFESGDKIAQIVIVRCELWTPERVLSLEDTERGTGGLGSTGR